MFGAEEGTDVVDGTSEGSWFGEDVFIGIQCI